MTLVEQILKECLDLPSEKAQEVLDFVDSLKALSSPAEEDRSNSGDLELRRQKAREMLARTRIDFGGKPMTDREEANARR